MIIECNFNKLNKNYKKILDFLKINSKYFILVQRNQLEFNQNFNKIMYELNTFLIEKYESSNWSGTILLNSKAWIYKFSVNNDSIEKIKILATDFSSWIYPDYPEDLSFLNLDGSELLTITTHEEFAYLNTNESNEERILTFFKNI